MEQRELHRGVLGDPQELTFALNPASVNIERDKAGRAI